MSKFDLFSLWEERFPKQEQVVDYAGRIMLKSAIGQNGSRFAPTIDHVRPISRGGADSKENIVICNRETNREKGNSFPNWKVNGVCFQAKRVSKSSGSYDIYLLDEEFADYLSPNSPSFKGI